MEPLPRDSSEHFQEVFEDNRTHRRRFRLTLRDGKHIDGVPTPREGPGGEPWVALLGSGDLYYRFPVSEIAAAERIEEQDDRYFMSIAIEQSRRCSTPPVASTAKPLVGAVLVLNGSELGRAYRSELKEGEHAEFTLLERRFGSRVVAGGTLYTTLEPCTKRGEGKTPCVERIIERRLHRVVIGILDPNKDIRGEGVWRLRESGVQVSLCDSVQMAQIEEINRPFVAFHRPRKS
jgi:pyrimidine deaminase RibD-like protein